MSGALRDSGVSVMQYIGVAGLVCCTASIRGRFWCPCAARPRELPVSCAARPVAPYMSPGSGEV